MRTNVIVCLVCLLMACSNSGQTAPESTPTNAASKPNILLSMERVFGECLGKCPVYKVSLYEDGAVEFVGTENVKQIGLVRRQVPLESVGRLKDLFDATRFSAMQDEYVRGTNCSTPVLSDADTVIVTYFAHGNEKRVTHYQGCMNTRKGAEGKASFDLDSLFKIEAAIPKETGIESLIGNK